MADHSNWMGGVHELIKDAALCRVPLPGSHDSGTYGNYDNQGLAQTQSLSVAEQLALGIRFFDLRVRCRNKEFYVHHGVVGTANSFSDANGDGILRDVVDFARAHPQELVILHCWDMDDGPGGSGFPDTGSRNASFIEEVVNIIGDRLLARGQFGPVESVAGLLARGQVIVMTDWVAGNTGDLIWSQQKDLVDYYDPPTISVPTGGFGVGGNGTGVTAGKMDTLISDLDTAIRGRQNASEFYKYQGIFNYDGVQLNGFRSMMEYGAQLINGPVVTSFRDLIVDAILNSSTMPNIIIVDFVEQSAVVGAVVDIITYMWKSTTRPYVPLYWMSKQGDGTGWMVDANPTWDFRGGNRYSPWSPLVGLWVKAQDDYGVVDFAEVWAGGSTTDVAWHYGSLYSKVTPVYIEPGGNQPISRIDVVNIGGKGIVNVRVHGQNGNESDWAYANAAQDPVITGWSVANTPITAFESAYTGGYGVVNTRYSTMPA